jgi:hypothetical protein
LEELNRHIIGDIKIIQIFYGEKYDLEKPFSSRAMQDTRIEIFIRLFWAHFSRFARKTGVWNAPRGPLLQFLRFAYATPPGRGDEGRQKAVRLILQTGSFPRAGP